MIRRYFYLVSLMILAFSMTALAQRPRMTEDTKTTPQTNTNTQEQKKQDSTENKKDSQDKTAATQTTAPQMVKVKYEGGVFGYRQKMDGYLVFEDVNSRLVFKDKQQKEMFSISYESISAAFADTQSRRPTAATVIGSSVPYGLGLPALLIKKKYRYLTLQYNDSDVNVAGVTSFKMENKEILEEMLRAVAGKAELSQRGEIYVRKRAAAKTSSPFTEER